MLRAGCRTDRGGKDRHWLGEALQRDWLQRFENDLLAKLRGYSPGDEHLPGFGTGAEARSQIHVAANGGVIASQMAADGANHDLSGIDADADVGSGLAVESGLQ